MLGHKVVSRTCPPVRGMKLFANTRAFARTGAGPPQPLSVPSVLGSRSRVERVRVICGVGEQLHQSYT